ncbi:hypothetical protein [Ruania halotolerans]|uniref:hypothetical protein n=1 Tax=Ruania halotolerans TaxID=2897773 RepID=UPI001E3BFAFC|nr:hypothetical protein [Ruania halotolerans]UFU06420.1 hypothetical protein LQF10_18675 [Ruania halotolerans]
MLRSSKKLTPAAFWFFFAAAALPTVLGLLAVIVMKVSLGSDSVLTYGFQFSRRGQTVGSGPTPGTEFTADQMISAFLPGLAILGAAALVLSILFAVRWPTFVLGTLGIAILALAPVNAAMAALASGANWGGIVLLVILAVAFVAQRFLLTAARDRVIVTTPQEQVAAPPA